MEEPDVEAALTEEERKRILAEEVAAFDGTWLNGKVDYRGILGFTEDMAAYAVTAEETGAADAGTPEETDAAEAGR